MPTPISVSEILSVVTPLVREGGRLSSDTRLLSSGLIDSFATAELAAALEARFGVCVPLEKLGSEVADTAADLATLLASLP